MQVLSCTILINLVNWSQWPEWKIEPEINDDKYVYIAENIIETKGAKASFWECDKLIRLYNEVILVKKGCWGFMSNPLNIRC